MFPASDGARSAGADPSNFVSCSPVVTHITVHSRDSVAASAQAPSCQKAIIQKATMSETIQTRIIEHLKSEDYRPVKPRGLARELNLHQEEEYHAFREALRDLMHAGRIVLGASGSVVLASQSPARDEFTGTYRQNRRGFGFVVPTDPTSREDLFIPEG